MKNNIIITIHTVKNISTVQLKSGNFYIIENTSWSGEARFPFKVLLKGIYKLIKYRAKEKYRVFKTELINKIIGV